MDIVKIFEDLGFSIHYKAGSEIGMFNIDKYEGVSVTLDTVNDMFTISSSSLKYFGSMSFPGMSIKRPVGEIVKMLDTMKHYYNVIENNQPW